MFNGATPPHSSSLPQGARELTKKLTLLSILRVHLLKTKRAQFTVLSVEHNAPVFAADLCQFLRNLIGKEPADFSTFFRFPDIRLTGGNSTDKSRRHPVLPFLFQDVVHHIQ